MPLHRRCLGGARLAGVFSESSRAPTHKSAGDLVGYWLPAKRVSVRRARFRGGLSKSTKTGAFLKHGSVAPCGEGDCERLAQRLERVYVERDDLRLGRRF